MMKTVRTLKPHDTAAGMKWPGDEYERTVADATYLAEIGVVEIIGDGGEDAPVPTVEMTPTPAEREKRGRNRQRRAGAQLD